MKLLPIEEWTFHQENPEYVIVGAHEHCDHRYYLKFPVSNLPNGFVSVEDLKRIGIDLEHRSPVK